MTNGGPPRRASCPAAPGACLTGVAVAQACTDTEPRELEGQPVPEPPPERSCGRHRYGRPGQHQPRMAGRRCCRALEVRAATIICTVRRIHWVPFAPEGRTPSRRHHCTVFHARQTRYQGYPESPGIKVGILGLMKSAAMQFGEIQLHGERAIPWTGGHRTDSLSRVFDQEHG